MAKLLVIQKMLLGLLKIIFKKTSVLVHLRKSGFASLGKLSFMNEMKCSREVFQPGKGGGQVQLPEFPSQNVEWGILGVEVLHLKVSQFEKKIL